MGMTLPELAGRLHATLVPADAQGTVTGVGPLDAAGSDQLTFATHERYRAAARTCRAAAILVTKPIEEVRTPQLVVESVDAALIEALLLFAPVLRPATEGIDPTARVSPKAQVGRHVSIGPYVVLEEGVRIGDHTEIGAGCTIGQDVQIGGHTRLDANVVIYHGCRIGSHVIIQANSTIGSVGFGYALIDGVPRLIPHNGGVIIEDFVEIGANCCIDRAKFTNTIVGAGTKLDNLVQVGHNVVIGRCCLISSQVGIGGSSRVGDGVVLGGQVGLADNLLIGDRATIGPQSGVMRDVKAGDKRLLTPDVEMGEAWRVIAEIQRLPRTARQLKELTKRVERLEAPENDQG